MAKTAPVNFDGLSSSNDKLSKLIGGDALAEKIFEKFMDELKDGEKSMEQMMTEIRAFFGIAKPAEESSNEFFNPNSKKVENLDELVGYVKQAKANSKTLRCVGSNHSVKGARYDDDSLVIYLEGDLRKVTQVKDNVFEVGAGVNIGCDPSNPSSTWDNSLATLLIAKGYALPICGGLSHQTVAGFLLTGSGGGSTQVGYDDIFLEFQFVDGDGELQVATKGSKDMNKKFNVTGDDLFNAFGVSMGLLGVLYKCKIATVENFFMEGTEHDVEFADSPLATAAIFRESYSKWYSLHMNWYKQGDKLNAVQVNMSNKAPVLVEGDPKFKPFHNALRNKSLQVAAAVAIVLGNLIPSVALRAFYLKFFINPGAENANRPFYDSWIKVLPSDNEVPVDTWFAVDFTEVWIEIDQVEEAFDILNKAFEEDPLMTGNFAVEMYAAKGCDFWLSPAVKGDVVRIDPYWFHHNLKGKPYPFFLKYWQKLLVLSGARMHWGKYIPSANEVLADGLTWNQEFLKSRYPNYDRFMELRKLCDPCGVFLSQYWQEHLFI